MSLNLLDKSDDPLDLENIRRTLVRLEDTIIFLLIERAQFAHCPSIYQPGHPHFASLDNATSSSANGLGIRRDKLSFLQWMLKECESWHAKVRRYESPDEYPFTPRSHLPPPLLPALTYPALLHPNSVNVNQSIYVFYTREIVPALTVRRNVDDDGNYGSAATRDVEALQAISKRIHYGKFVSESKFRAAPYLFVPHILNPNPKILEGLITKPAVEAALLKRLEKKAAFYGQELDANGLPTTSHIDAEKAASVGQPRVRKRIEAMDVVRMYEKHVIPLTKEVEYLLHRLDGLSAEEVETLGRPPAV